MLPTIEPIETHVKIILVYAAADPQEIMPFGQP